MSVTIYRDLFALVTETRTVDLPAGPGDAVVRRRGRDAAARSRPWSPSLGRALAERNYDYDHALRPATC